MSRPIDPSIPPRREAVDEKLDRLARAVERLASKIEKIESIETVVRTQGYQIDAVSKTQDATGKQLSDASTMVKIGKWSLSLLLPLVYAAVALIQDHHRQANLEKEIEASRDRIAQIEHDTGAIRSDIRLANAEDSARDKTIATIRDAITKIEESLRPKRRGVPK